MLHLGPMPFAVVALLGVLMLVVSSNRFLRASHSEHDDTRSSARSHLVWVGASALLGVAGICGVLWTSNTIVPAFDRIPETDVAVAGQTVMIETGKECGEQHSFVYRQSQLGRWQRTHKGGRQDKREWFDTSGEELLTLSVCTIGPRAGDFNFVIPDTVEPGVVALCGSGRSCAKVTIVEASPSAS